MITLEDYKKFLLRKRKKKSGDKLVDSTIERYTYFIEPYQHLLTLPPEKMVEEMNVIMNKRRSSVLHGAFTNLLEMRGFDKESDVRKSLKSPQLSANAQTSRRFLESKVLSVMELKKIMDEAPNDEFKLLVSCLYDTACRRSELLSIKIKDLDFTKIDEQNNIYARVRVLGKGKKSREVYLGKTTMDLIRKLRNLEDGEGLLFNFRGKNGEIVKKQDDFLWKLIKRNLLHIIEKEGHPHCFRHTKATHMADNGADAMYIMAYLGHTDIKTSMIYIEISTFKGREAYSKYSRDILE